MLNSHLMPQARLHETPIALDFDVPPQAFERWNPLLVTPNAADDKESDQTITILDRIGVDMWTGEGVSDKRIAAALRAIGDNKDVTVLLNSPGGSLPMAISIYNMLREHKGKVTVKILGLAASAASLVAMAGDEIRIARTGFFMIHDAWVATMGNRNDLRDVADWLEPFDMGMAEVFSARTGVEVNAIMKRMDAETWINGSAAVAEGWADDLLASDQVVESKARAQASIPGYRLDLIMAKAGMTRSDRRALLQDFKASTLRAAPRKEDGTPSAADEATGTPSAAEAAAFLDFLKTTTQELSQ